MIKNFFHSLNSQDVSYLLISGQASVLYGAATFSEDIDLWVEPETSNWNKFLTILKNIGAKIYKLTPPVSTELIKKGYGYHFQLPSDDRKILLWFLDVMGVVPRVKNFKQAFKNVVYKKTDWGEIPVVGIRDLVEIKKTRRLEDYSVISNLVRIEYNNLSPERINRSDWKWILKNSFDIEDILFYISSHNIARSVSMELKRKCLSFCLKAVTNQKAKERHIESASRKIALEIEDLRKNDREYWKPIIDELKEMREKRQLIPAGSKLSVADTGD